MNIALVTETFPPEVNGVAMTFGVITRELSRRGHVITVYRPRRAGQVTAGGREAEGIREVALPGFSVPTYPQLRLGWPAGRALERAWTQDRPDLVHVATEGPLGASAVATARRLGLPVTSSFHTHFHRYAGHYGIGPLRPLVLRWLRYVHNRTRRTFAPTAEVAAELAGHGFSGVGILARGVDTWAFHPARRSPELRFQWGVAPDDPVLIHVGRLAPEKNYELLFRCYAAMREANPRLRIVVAGEGPLQARLQREHPDVIFAGFFSRQEIGRYYASADLYVHASLTETFGNVVTEALASGLAFAGFDYAAAAQFVRHGENGLLAPCGRPDALIDAAVMLATDGLLREQVRRQARAAVEGQSWERVIADFEAELLAAAGQPRRVEVAA